VPEADSTRPTLERRRSKRVADSLPLIVRGINLLGQPFEERTNTLAFNLHGCRYVSKHHLPKNTWVALELPQSSHRRNVRARVAWVHRPHSVRELFQIAVELESSANIWEFKDPPADWLGIASAIGAPISHLGQREVRIGEGFEAGSVAPTISTHIERPIADMTNLSPDPHGAESTDPFNFAALADSPLLRELRAELEREAKKSVETAALQAKEEIRRTAEEDERTRVATAGEIFQKWKEELAQAQNTSREEFSAQFAQRQEEFQTGLKSEFEINFIQTRNLMADLDRKAQDLRAEGEAAQQTTDRMAQARLQLEAAEASRAAKPPAEASKEDLAATERAADGWRQRLGTEMALAQAQWNELLQSSLDSNMKRLVEQLSEQSRELLRNADQKITERFAELREPLTQISSEARETVKGIQSWLDQEVARARASLAEIEQSASRVTDYSAQLEAASHDSLNELHRRLERILEAQTAEMNHRVDALAAGLSQRVAPSLDALGQEFVRRTVAEAESKFGPHLERVPELLRELSAREVQMEESLRLHRERLRQVSEQSQREVATQLVATVDDLRSDFEGARKEALARWNEELDASSVRASHTASDSISHASEWLQQETRARLQMLVEHALEAAGAGFQEKTAEAARAFENDLAGQSSARVALIEQRLEKVAGELVSHAGTQLDEAAKAAAASFGQVLEGISSQEVERFTNTSRGAIQERKQEFEHSMDQRFRDLDGDAGALVARFRAQMASQQEASIAEGHSALATEFASALEGYRAERDAHQKEWLGSLEHLGSQATGKFQERLETASDSWVVSSVRRLNEHGQNVIESLLRSSDQALRDSCSKVFEGLAGMLRERTANAAGIAGFTQAPNREAAEAPSPSTEGMPNRSND
jgi:hypothetical protein